MLQSNVPAGDFLCISQRSGNTRLAAPLLLPLSRLARATLAPGGAQPAAKARHPGGSGLGGLVRKARFSWGSSAQRRDWEYHLHPAVPLMPIRLVPNGLKALYSVVHKVVNKRM